MKKSLILLLAVIMVLSFAACGQHSQIEVVHPPKDIPEAAEPTPDVQQAPVQDPDIPDLQMPELPEDTDDMPEPIPEPTPAPTPIGMSGDLPENPRMYTSYAHMVSFDPARGWAEFDYFDMLTGQDAIDFLVEHEGYTVAEAEDEVSSYADGEFCYKNTNPQLRTVDLRSVPISLQYHADGTPEPSGVDSTVADVFALYELNTNYLYEYNFFKIYVDAGGNVTLVEQIYWC